MSLLQPTVLHLLSSLTGDSLSRPFILPGDSGKWCMQKQQIINCFILHAAYKKNQAEAGSPSSAVSRPPKIRLTTWIFGAWFYL